jgi:outer membrane lipoprotein LolB
MALSAMALASCSLAPRVAPTPAPGRVDVPVDATADAWPGRRAELQSRTQFALRGRVAVAAAEDGFSAGLRWQQHASGADIRLDGPLGVGGLRIETVASELRLTTSHGERLDGVAARAELERRLGFALPIEALRFWVQGVPAPGSEASETRAPDAPRLIRLEQQGWRIDYADYGQSDSGALPRRVAMTRAGARLRLVIETWERGEP